MDRRQFLQTINANGMSAMLPASAFVSGSSSGPTQMAPSPATDDRAFVEVAATPWNIPKIGIVSVGGIGGTCLPTSDDLTQSLPFLSRTIAVHTYGVELGFMKADPPIMDEVSGCFTPYFRAPQILVLGLRHDNGFHCWHFDGRRFELVP